MLALQGNATSYRIQDFKPAYDHWKRIGKIPESPASDLQASTSDQDDGDGDGNEEFEPEDDDLRRLAMNEVMSREELNGLRLCDQKDADHREYSQPEAGPSRTTPIIPSSSLSSTYTDPAQPTASKKRKGVLDGIVQDEITKRKRESLGMDGPGAKLGSKSASSKKSGGSMSSETSGTKSKGRILPWLTQDAGGDTEADAKEPVDASADDRKDTGAHWTCSVCTL